MCYRRFHRYIGSFKKLRLLFVVWIFLRYVAFFMSEAILLRRVPALTTFMNACLLSCFAVRIRNVFCNELRSQPTDITIPFVGHIAFHVDKTHFILESMFCRQNHISTQDYMEIGSFEERSFFILGLFLEPRSSR